MSSIQNLVGHEFEPTTFTYTDNDAILYALGIGAGRDPLEEVELRFVYENAPTGFRVFPTFATTFGHGVMWQILSLPGLDVNPMMLLHGEHALELPRPLPHNATLTNHARIAAIYDKGSGALFHLEVTSEDKDGKQIAFNRYSVFARGLGGFGGERGPSGSTGDIPQRAPDAVHKETIPPNQALLYRLSGDRNPLHADPRMARIAGFHQPILHGLSTFGSAVRAVFRQMGYDTDRFRGASARFSHHVFPGETLITELWEETENQIRFRCNVMERSELVLANGALSLDQSVGRQGRRK